MQKATSALSLGQRHADPILPLYVCGVEVFYMQNTKYFIDPVTGNYSVISQDIYKIYIYFNLIKAMSNNLKYIITIGKIIQ